MKRIISTLFLMACISEAFAQKQFMLSGNIPGAPNAFIKLYYSNSSGKNTVDSSLLHNGTFSFKGNIEEPTRAFLAVGKASTMLFLEPKEITVKCSPDFKAIEVTGSKTQAEHDQLYVKLNEVDEEFQPLSDHIKRVNKELNEAKKQNKSAKAIDSLDAALTALKNKQEPFSEKYEAVIKEFVTTHPDSYISPIEMSVYISSWSFESVKMIFGSFSPAVKNSPVGRSITKMINEIAAHSANTLAPNISKSDVNGKMVTLAALKGKYVLLDFWGSWCVPCRQSTPHLIAMFNKYHRAGLEVIGIADDDKTQADWKRAIKKDKTQLWYNILAGPAKNANGSDNPASLTNKYAVGVLPTKILVDQNGTIIARFVGTDKNGTLDKKLAEIFAK